ncbi:hypothetical protein AYO44_00725 [Planctomycetaceae bacterium SCGC AG-212-F19]|nr:hypothetical protein AYO44_00725 [Planctomycetaceae bacterium SCGC AG-212-F19]
MLRKLVCASIAAFLCVSVVMADEFGAAITKVEDGKITFAKTKFNKDTKKLEKSDAETLPVAADCKVNTGKFNKDTKKLEAGDPVPNGLKNEMFSKEVNATIITDADNKKVIEIRVRAGKKAAK